MGLRSLLIGHHMPSLASIVKISCHAFRVASSISDLDTTDIWIPVVLYAMFWMQYSQH